MKKLNLGCGLQFGPSWINIDGSFNAVLANYPSLANFLEKIRIVDPKWRKWPQGIMWHDIIRKLPFKNDTIDAIYGSHILEHFCREDAIRILVDIKRVLRPGGILRLIVPDTEELISNYLKNKTALNNKKEEREIGGYKIIDRGADELMIKSCLGKDKENRPWTLIGFWRMLTDYLPHKWMYDRESLKGLLSDLGFNEILEVEPLVSKIPDINEVERVEALGPGNNGFGVECVVNK